MASWRAPDVIEQPQPREDMRPFDGRAVAAGADGAVADDADCVEPEQVGMLAEPHRVDVDAVRHDH